MTVLTAARVGKRYGARAALSNVSFNAAAGERLAIIGPNGAGKTTLLQILAGGLVADSGDVTVPRSGWVPQRAAVYSKLTVRENLELFARLEHAPVGAVDRMLELTGLSPGDETGRLSGGSRQRLNIAVGLLGDPPLVLLDEPSASLDPRQRERLWAFISGLPATIVYTTHDVGEADRYADRVLVLADGELLFTGTPSELRAGSNDLEAAFVAFLHDRGH
jgi:ABC-2 type transport system ATP-binding protein